MKHIKTWGIFEGGNPETKKNLAQKLRNLNSKEDDIDDKRVDNAQKLRSEDDPRKAELINLQQQKLSLQKAMTKVDMKITALKLKIENSKPYKA
jgi:hypothetical protein